MDRGSDRNSDRSTPNWGKKEEEEEEEKDRTSVILLYFLFIRSNTLGSGHPEKKNLPKKTGNFSRVLHFFRVTQKNIFLRF
jgi:hypothetical protein